MHVLFDVLLAFQLGAHRFQRAAEVAELAGAVGRADAFASGDGIGIAAQRPELARQPPCRKQADHQRRAQQHEPPAQDHALAAGDERRDRLIGFGDGEHADDPRRIAIAHGDRRGHMHHRAGLVVRIAARRPRAVATLEGEIDIVPARIILAQILAAGIEHHDAARVGHVDAGADLALGEAPDFGAEIAVGQRAHVGGEAAIVDASGQQIVLGLFRQQIGGVDQGVFHRLAHARLHFLQEHPAQQQRGQRDDQEIAQQDAQTDFHARGFMRDSTAVDVE